MRKKIISVILFVLITLIASTIYAAITANATLTLSDDKVKPGEEFTVTLRMKDIDAGSDGLMGAQLKIDYNKEIFEALSESSMKGLSGLTANYNESAKGNILIVSAMSGIKTESDFVKVTFKVKENAELKDATITFKDIEIFNLEKTKLGDKSVTVEVVEKEDEKQESTLTPTPSAKPTSTPNGGSESTPTPSTKPNVTPTPTTTAKPNNGENKNDVPVTNINTNTGNGSSGSSSNNKGTIKGPTTSSSSLPKAGIGSTISILTVIVAIIGAVAYIKLRNYKEI